MTLPQILHHSSDIHYPIYMPRLAPSPCNTPQCKNMKPCIIHARSSEKAYEERRPSSSKRGYNRSHQRLRKMIFAEQPICAVEGCIEPSYDLDHINGDSWDRRRENLQGLCHSCHAIKTSHERGVWKGADWLPSDIPIPSIPVTVVCGPPGSGKTTYVNQHAKEQDIVIDLDEIKSRLSGLPWYQAGDAWFRPAILERNRMLRGLSLFKGKKAWLIVSAPLFSHRRFWRESLNAQVIVLEVDAHVCIERIKRDARRSHNGRDQEQYVTKWWANYSSDMEDVVITGG